MTAKTLFQAIIEVLTGGRKAVSRWAPVLLLSMLLPIAARADSYAYAAKGLVGLYQINLATGAQQFIGPTAVSREPILTLDALALSPDGVLFGTSGSQLFRVDTRTGALKRITSTIRENGWEVEIWALTFNGSTLLGAEAAVGRPHLVAIDPSTGIATALASIGSNLIGQAMTMLDSTTALITANNGSTLYKLNIQTGETRLVGALPFPCFALTMASDHKLYAMDLDERLVSVDTGNAIETPIAAVGPGPHPWTDMVAIPPPAISGEGVLNAASLRPGVAPGTLATVFGTGFAPVTSEVSPPMKKSVAPLPITLGGVSVTINGTPAPIYYAAWNQISFQVPYEVHPGPASLTIASPSGTTVFRFVAGDVAPGIFHSPDAANVAVATDHNGNPIDSQHPINSGSKAIVYLTGQGFLNNPVPTGHAAPQLPVSIPVVSFSATVGAAPAPVLSVEMTPGLIGVFQIELVVPQLPSATHQVVVTATECTPTRGCGSVASNAAELPVNGAAPHIDSVKVWWSQGQMAGFSLLGSGFDPQWSKAQVSGGWCDTNPGSCVAFNLNGSRSDTLILSSLTSALPSGTYHVFVTNWLPQYGIWGFPSNVVTMVVP